MHPLRSSLVPRFDCVIVTAVVALCASQVAYGAHPLVTDDTGTQDTGNQQIEFNLDRIRQTGARSTAGALTYTYGSRPDTDLFINLPATLQAPSGINDASLGAKWRFFENSTDSVALKTELSLPSGAVDKGRGNGKPGLALTIIASHLAAPWALHANAALTISQYALATDRDAKRLRVWHVSAAAVYSVTSQWKLALDGGVDQDTDSLEKRLPAYLLAGVIYSPTPAIDFDAGIRFGIGCRTCGSQISRQPGLGLTARF